MSLTFKKNILYQILLVFCALILLAESYELTFSVWFISVCITLRNNYSVTILRFLGISLFILIIAFISSLSHEYKLYNFFRDVAYLIKPILGMLLGYQFCKILGQKILKTIMYAGIALAIVHITILFVYYVFVGIKDLNTLRHYGGYFDDLEVYVLILILFREKFEIELSKKRALLYLCIVGLSSFLYFARTNIIQFFILFFAMKGFFTITKRSLKIAIYVTVLILGSYTAIYQSNPRREGQGIQAFLYKIKIAPIEPFKTRINKDDWKDFNDNYRSFENIITVRQVSSGGFHDILLGKGLGSTIDLGRMVYSNDGEFIQYIPTLHNAYMTVFLKSGLLGVVLLIYFIVLLFRHQKTSVENIKQINYLLVGSAFFMILSNWVFMGLYLKLDNKSIVLGALICYREFLYKKYYKQSCLENE